MGEAKIVNSKWFITLQYYKERCIDMILPYKCFYRNWCKRVNNHLDKRLYYSQRLVYATNSKINMKMHLIIIIDRNKLKIVAELISTFLGYIILWINLISLCKQLIKQLSNVQKIQIHTI